MVVSDVFLQGRMHPRSFRGKGLQSWDGAADDSSSELSKVIHHLAYIKTKLAQQWLLVRGQHLGGMCNQYVLGKDVFVGKHYAADVTAVLRFRQIVIMLFIALTLQAVGMLLV
ncbi:hypothetical protein MTO96_034918 [Rhipicephalus appendiculatus]